MDGTKEMRKAMDDTADKYLIIGNRLHHVEDFLAGDFEDVEEGEHDVSWPWPERL